MSNSGTTYQRCYRPNNEEQQPSTSTSVPLRQVATTVPQPPPQLVPRGMPPRMVPVGSLVVGEKILLPAGIMRLQPSAISDGGTNATWQPQTPPVRMLGSFTPSFVPQPIQPRIYPNDSNAVRRTTTKVVQAIPFVTSTSQQTQQQPQFHIVQQPQQQKMIGTTNQSTWYLTPQQTSGTSTTVSINSTSSATPDSGIQSVPTSPPSPNFQQASVSNADGSFCEEKEDFTDMPLLVPADQEDDPIDIPSVSVPQQQQTPEAATETTSTGEDERVSHESECETSATSQAISITQNMDSDEIVNRLLELDPKKASIIATLIKQKIQPPRKRKSQQQQHDETEVSSTTPATPKPKKMKKRSPSPEEVVVTTSTDQEEPSTSDETILKTEEISPEVKLQSKKRAGRPASKIEKPEKNELSGEELEIQYRLAIQKRMEEAMQKEINLCIEEVSKLTLPKGGIKKNRMTWTKSLSSLKNRVSKSGMKKLANKMKEEDSTTRKNRVLPRRSRNDESPDNGNIEGRFNGEYEEISRSIASSEDIYKYWKSPSLACGCSKGACTSDVQCLNRALRVQCSSECTLTLCANKKFWKEDTSRLCVSSGPKSKRYLRSRISRKAGELLCEYAGEVITSKEAITRFSNSSDSRILAIGANLFIDSTKKGNVGRFVKHSCKPNSRLEVWSINGVYRAGIFTLYDIASNCEITIDKNHLLPLDSTCNCGVSECRKIVRAAKNSIIASAIPNDPPNGRFLSRSRRRTIDNAKRSSGLPNCLFKESSRSPSANIGMKKVFEAISFRVKNIDGSIPYKYLPQYNNLRSFLKTSNPDPVEFNSLVRKWLDVVDDDDIDRALIPIQNKWLNNEVIEKNKKRSRISSISSTTSIQSPTPSLIVGKHSDADLSYLESENPIGSYDPDDAWTNYKANANDNAVRCVCGILDEDGEMVQCDTCHFWLHIDCDSEYNGSDEYNCEFCIKKLSGRPNNDVILKSQPDVRFEDCIYYKALVNRRGIQVRLNETVYVNKQVPEDHKNLLRNLREETTSKKKGKSKNPYEFPIADTSKIRKQEFDRKNTRIFRVERLFVTPGNNRFVFGSFYAWPHETYVDTQRMFSQKEVFPTPLYETLPLDEVIGRCMVIDVETWCKGRPTVPLFKEDDVFLCEYQVAKNQRCFEKVPAKNRYPINTNSYVFNNFSKPKKVVRNFRPYSERTPSSTPSKNQKMVSPKEKDKKSSKIICQQQNNLKNIVDKLSRKK
ncbi:unnamed protein product [Caenorhabditis angaria]|uniref:SET domain-containing protein n=1 Tax=Caenorhabditis angaria TaxID=860376 RepID=A0A9P1I5P0_9PELO|nr:unnamed protein product [Caenorhabditis angaria]